MGYLCVEVHTHVRVHLGVPNHLIVKVLACVRVYYSEYIDKWRLFCYAWGNAHQLVEALQTHQRLLFSRFRTQAILRA